MRHGLKIKKIGRNASHRKATLQSMSISLITYKRITTTLGKARALRIFVEPILHRAKDTSTNSRRQAFRRLQSKEAVKTLYGEVASAIADRPGGYTRIVKLGQRDGDAAEMAVVEIVDFNDVKPEGAAQTKRRTRRSRGKAGAGDATAALAPQAAALSAPAAEAPAAEEVVPEAPADETSATDEAVDTTGAEAPVEEAKAEAVVNDSATPDTTGNPVIPQTPQDSDHPDAEQGAAPLTGEPPPESEPTNRGRSGHRG
jgi:large subunit ribosomal protein L17